MLRYEVVKRVIHDSTHYVHFLHHRKRPLTRSNKSPKWVSRTLTHWGRVPSHYLNQWWNIVNCWTMGNTFQWNFHQSTTIFVQENAFEMSSGKWLPFCLGLNVLNQLPRPMIWCDLKSLLIHNRCNMLEFKQNLLVLCGHIAVHQVALWYHQCCITCCHRSIYGHWLHVQ